MMVSFVLSEEGIDLIKSLCDKYKEVPSLEEGQNIILILVLKNASLDEIGTAECSAGLFDMLDLDKKTVGRKELKADDSLDLEDAIYRILFHASRMLLVTRGLDATTDEQVFKLFEKHFITTNLVDESFRPLIAWD